MKLFVDDLRICPEGWELARTNTDAIRILATGYVEEISIDHDIAHPRSDGKGWMIIEETFQPVVYYICRMRKPLPGKITLHTSNHSAAMGMRDLLRDAQIGCHIEESRQDFAVD